MRPTGALDNLKNQVLYSLLPSEYPQSPAASARIEAFDALDLPLL